MVLIKQGRDWIKPGQNFNAFATITPELRLPSLWVCMQYPISLLRERIEDVAAA